jgi:hypothetical protein
MTESFTWAGFSFPRAVVELPRGTRAERLERARSGQACGPYRHAPQPLTGGPHPGKGVYHSGGALGRWNWADEVDSSISHKGWYCDDWMSEVIRGIVISLPHGLYSSGWSMGEGMAASIDGGIYADSLEAARAADDSARTATECEREFQDTERAREEQAARVERVRTLWPVRHNTAVRSFIRDTLKIIRDNGGPA